MAGLKRQIRLILADEQALLRCGLRAILEREDDIQVIAEASNIRDLLTGAHRLQPTVVVADLAMDAVRAAQLLSRPNGTQPVGVVIMAAKYDDQMLEALQAGARGLLLKDDLPEELVRAVRVVANGQALVAPSIASRLLDRLFSRLPVPVGPVRIPATLTPRELEVLEMVARGRSNAEIARMLVLSEATVRSHIHHLLVKLSLHDRSQLVAFAYQTGLARP